MGILLLFGEGEGVAAPSADMTFVVEAAFGSYPSDDSYVWTQIHSSDDPSTGYVRSMSWQRGLDDIVVGRTETGTGRLQLKNGDRAWDPLNTASPFYPDVIPDLPVRCWVNFAGELFYPFQHYAQGLPRKRIGPNWSEVDMSTRDGFAGLALASPSPEVAELTVDPAGVNNTLVFTAVRPGIAEQDITIQMIGGPFKPVRVSVNEKAIEIRYHQTGLHGDPDDTAATILAAVNAHNSANQLVTVTHGAGSDGSGSILTDFGPTNLAGGDAASFPQELTGARIARCLDQAGWPAALRDIDPGTVQVAAAPFASNEQGRLLSHMLDVAGEAAEFGLVFVAGNGNLVFQDRNTIYTNGDQDTYAATFSDTRDDGFPIYVDASTDYSADHIINEWVGNREGGVAIIVRDDESIAHSLGRTSHSIQSQLTTDTQLQASLEFGRDEYGQPTERLQQVQVMPGADTDLWKLCLGMELGDRIRILEHPPTGPAYESVYLVTKVAGQLQTGSMVSGSFTFGLWPIRITNYFVWDDDTTDGYSDAVLADSPAGYWRLDEAHGDFSDWSGADHTSLAVSTSGITYGVDGVRFTGIQLDGAAGYFTVGDAFNLDFGDVLTMEAWVKRGATGASRTIFDKGINAYRMYLNSSGALSVAKQGVALIVTATTPVPGDSAWHHVVYTKNGATSKMYLDGVDVTGVVTNATMADNSTNLAVGVAFDLASEFFNGSLDELAVYPTALSAARVLAHYNAGIAAATTAFGNLDTTVLAYN